MLERSRSYQEFAALASDARLFCAQHRPKRVTTREEDYEIHDYNI